MLNRKTQLGIAIIIIVCLSMIALVWWWYGQQIAQLENKLVFANEEQMVSGIN
jgi:hypothetical protein